MAQTEQTHVFPFWSRKPTRARPQDESDEDAWRVYLDYGFLPIENEGTVKLDGNSNTGNLSLSDILENVSSIATLRAGFEYGRFGLQTGVFHGATSTMG